MPLTLLTRLATNPSSMNIAGNTSGKITLHRSQGESEGPWARTHSFVFLSMHACTLF